ncbi:MAG TPA: hypothetical protein VFL57_20160 [Bryobacteraceae bacterium]|nr:hypothetical protein [Bryobacteraceae bacterium]
MGCIIALGLFAGAQAAMSWATTNILVDATLVVFAVAAAMMKVRVPGITGTYSLSFVGVLIAIPALSPSELVSIAAISALVQCLWHARTRPTPTEIIFNISAVILSAAIAQTVYSAAMTHGRGSREVAVIAMSAALYWVVNTGVISVLLALLREGGLREVWQQWCLWSLPLYLAGASVAGLLSSYVRAGDWIAPLLFLPLLLLAGLYYRIWAERYGQAAAAVCSTR